MLKIVEELMSEQLLFEFKNCETFFFYHVSIFFKKSMDSSFPKNIPLIKDFQDIIFSSTYDILLIKEKIEEIENFFSSSEIDHQLILAFSLDYDKIPSFKSLLSKSNLEEKDFIHFDQELLFHLLQSHISFPLSVITKNIRNIISGKLQIEQNLYEELQKQNYLEEIEKKYKEEDEDCEITIREKTKIEEIIENDDIESLKLLSNSNNFDFNQKIEKNNELYHYCRIPILLYCIEKNAFKCFKFALINGANPSIKSEKRRKWRRKEYKEVWDAYGFAGAKGNIQIIRILEEKGFKPTECLIEGCSQFHQKGILEMIKKEQSHLLNPTIKEIVFYENFEIIDLLILKGYINSDQKKQGPTPLHYAAKKNLKDIGEVLISKGADSMIQYHHFL